MNTKIGKFALAAILPAAPMSGLQAGAHPDAEPVDFPVADRGDL